MEALIDEKQQRAVDKLKSGSILSGGVGSGKSRAALAYYIQKELNYGTEERDLYIITTAKKRDSGEWAREVETALEWYPFINFTCKIDSWNNITKYCNAVGGFFIFDEQRLVGRGTWVKAFYRIANVNHWILLSATPGDTWMDYIPVFVANGFYKNRTEFCREHVQFSRYTKYPKIERYFGVNKLIYLKNRILVEMDYVKPTLMHHEYIMCEYNKTLYVKTAKERWDSRTNQPFKNISGLCQGLRYVVNSDFSRYEALTKLVNLHPKVIVFYNYNYELDIIRELQSIFKDHGFAEWNGQKHMDIPRTDKWIYAVQYSAGAEGWECIETDVIIFYSATYSYKQSIQAAGRIDRRNTPFSDLYCYHLTSQSPIDKAIQKCLEEKRDFNESTFGREKS